MNIFDTIISSPVYLCTRKETKERHESTIKELSKLNLNSINTIYGLNGSDLNVVKEIKEKAICHNLNINNCKNYGEVALGIAFQEAVKLFLKSSSNHMVWFEDDAILHPSYKELLPLLNEFKDWNNYNVIYLGTTIVDNEPLIEYIVNNNINWIDSSKENIWCTQSLLIDRQGANAIIQNANKQSQIDTYIVDLAKNLKIIKTAGLTFPLIKHKNWKRIYSKKRNNKNLSYLNEYKKKFGNIYNLGIFYQRNQKSTITFSQKI